MITNLHLESFKSFKKLDFELKPLNVLIGANGSGKSNFLDFFRFMQEAIKGELGKAISRRGGKASLSFGYSTNALGVDLVARLKFPTAFWKLFYSFSIIGADTGYWVKDENLRATNDKSANRQDAEQVFPESGAEKEETEDEDDGFFIEDKTIPGELGVSAINFPGSDERIKYLSFQFGKIQWVSNILTGEGLPLRVSRPSEFDTTLEPNGDNLSSVLYSLYNHPKYASIPDEINNILSIAYPGFERLLFPSTGQGQIIVSWKDKRFKRSFDASVLSDGMLRFLCLLAILKNPAPPPLILIDEPEVGLHPRLMPLIGELLKEAATRTQLIVATHSPLLVDHLGKEHICVTELDDEGATTIRRATELDIDNWLADFTLGDLWLQGHLGGNPW